MSYPQGPQQGPGNNRPSNNPFNGNPFNRNNNGGNSGQNGNGNGQRPFWQSPWLWGVLVVLIAIGSFQIFAGSGTQTIDTKDGFALLKNGTVSYAKIIDNKQLVKLELTSDYTKTDPDTGRQRNYGKDVQFYYTFAQGAQVVQAVEKANPSKGWTSDMQSSSMMSYMLSSLLPILLLVALWWLLMRNMGGANGMFGMGGKKNSGKLLEGQTPTTKFSDVAGEDEAVAEVEEIKDFLKDPSKYKALGARIPRGVLLYGPPGTGKTLLARAIAGEAGVPFYSMAGSDFVEMFVGLGASRVRDLFDEAKKNAPAIIFIDEIDAVGRKRGSGMGGGHDEREQTLNQLLVEMDGFDNDTNLIIIAATNRPDVLDPALLRPGRFDRQVGVAAPDLEGREAILKVHAKGKPFVPDVDLHMIAVRTPGFTGADLANVLNEAALLCARAGAQLIDNRAIDEAIDRVQSGPRRKSKGMALEELRNTAYHEGGHALVAAAMHDTDPVTKVTILPRGRALGYTAVMPTTDRYSQSRNQLLDQMAYAMGGRTAEEIVFHDPTTGASNDIEKATAIARTMVTQYGFSAQLGAIKWGDEDEQTTVMDGLQPRKYSDRTAQVIDDEVLKLVETAHTEAWNVINENRDVLDELVRQLLVKETLNEKELAAIFANVKKAPVRETWLSNDRRPDSDKPPVEIPESLKRSVGMKPGE
ncbi:MAG: ATP-dependent zinc metalloprotease FtsH [Bifidobacterium scardovii]|uniref:ATP-dependent zinc metalloprotease FtsH n=1 Tax=Bifidobacterium scardovii TaxID=158787 RepID=UPI000668729B|nr:ATP-dependent zinc metalloprotease FtsH [Bifidobacterium scardovii]MBS6947197.1 ATP-dependent zinc metalloprotease FtsH [Bifidobacterium scardovii]MDU2422414.1 ATP-dependent zinc metalloprotease FtsH [Bifidobacterium scardovii]MDU3737058.1 ATP-dependent zinc metalloprotease FtsH [Bifidobacterium scardovii]MDU5297678.1 ATP-dependent zinc metalloprotease FtsH [Bifidobacterium scardovii]MDU5611840.1 ATP-dependent zinc metalloprotease FtsH [Bifidobacterium scardovii]